MKKIISIDIGGMVIKYALIDENSNILVKSKIDTEASLGGKAVLEKVINIIGEFQKEEIIGVSISTAGMVDKTSGEIFYSSNIPEYVGINFKKKIKEKFGIPCEVENDVKCAGLAEYMSGASKDTKVSVMIAIGTGIGGCIISDGKIFRGFSNVAGEVAYMQIDGSGKNFQEVASTKALIEKVATQKNDIIENWSGIRIFEEAEKGDIICKRAIDEMVDILGKGIANICCVINPEVVVLGGGIMEREEYLKEKIEKAVKKYLVPSIAVSTKIRFAKHKNDAGIIGAFYNFMLQNCDKKN